MSGICIPSSESRQSIAEVSLEQIAKNKNSFRGKFSRIIYQIGKPKQFFGSADCDTNTTAASLVRKALEDGDRVQNDQSQLLNRLKMFKARSRTVDLTEGKVKLATEVLN